jgi:hypothetical protein
MLSLHRRFRSIILLTILSVVGRVSAVAMSSRREPYLVRATYNFGAWHDPEFVELIRPKEPGCNLVLQTTVAGVSEFANRFLLGVSSSPL